MLSQFASPARSSDAIEFFHFAKNLKVGAVHAQHATALRRIGSLIFRQVRFQLNEAVFTRFGSVTDDLFGNLSVVLQQAP